MIRTRTLSLIGAAIGAALLMVPPASAQPRDAGIAGGHSTPVKHGPYACNRGTTKWSPRQNRCLVAYVFRHEPRVGREAARIITCESGWDEHQITPPYAAGGLAQFLPSTFGRTPYGRHSRLDPVWNVKAMRWLYHHDGNSWREWSCSRILGIR